MQHFYDGQIRRYITQLVRMFSNFNYKDGDGKIVQLPVTYGDLTRQVGNIIRDNSENKIPSAPRMAVYITGVEMDTARLADSSYVNKLNIRERAYDAQGNEYLKTEGKNYTVERLMPTPYKLTVNVDIWSTNTDQKLQVIEQILMLFNPSLEIQTTDNYIDWTSLSVVNLDSITWSSRSIPVGTESDIDISTMTFSTPIYISPPAKVKKLGVVTSIVQSIFNEQQGTVEINVDPSTLAENSLVTQIAVEDTGEITRKKKAGERVSRFDTDLTITTNHNQYGVMILGSSAQLIDRGIVGNVEWQPYITAIPEVFQPGISEIRLLKQGYDKEIAGTIAINPSDPTTMNIAWDIDTFPPNTTIEGPARNSNSWSTIDYIIDPTKSNPTSLKTVGARILLLGAIGDPDNTDGADAWKNNNNSDFVADMNDIVEWDGSQWHIVWDASDSTDIIYTTNLNTGVQYKWDTVEWVLSFEGEYPASTWRIKN